MSDDKNTMTKIEFHLEQTGEKNQQFHVCLTNADGRTALDANGDMDNEFASKITSAMSHLTMVAIHPLQQPTEAWHVDNEGVEHVPPKDKSDESTTPWTEREEILQDILFAIDPSMSNINHATVTMIDKALAEKPGLMKAYAALLW